MELLPLNTNMSLPHQEAETSLKQPVHQTKINKRVKTITINSLNLSAINNKLTKIEITDSRLIDIHQKRLNRLSINSNETLIEPNSMNATLIEPNYNETLINSSNLNALLAINSNLTLLAKNSNTTLLKYDPHYIIPLYSNDNDSISIFNSNDIPKYEVKLLSFTSDEKLCHEPIFYAPTSPGYFYIVENSTYKLKSKKL